MAASVTSVSPIYITPQLNISTIRWSSANLFLVQTTNALVANEFLSYKLRVPINTLITANVNLTASQRLELYDSTGALVSTTNSGVVTNFATVIANQDYTLVFRTSAAIAAAANLFFMGSTTTIVASQFFANGFVSLITPSSSLSVSAPDNNGSIIFTFTNYTLTQGQQVPLCSCSNAIQSGTVNVTSSDQTVYATTSFGFTRGEFLNIVLVSLKQTSFTGTITVAINNAGTSVSNNITSPVV